MHGTIVDRLDDNASAPPRKPSFDILVVTVVQAAARVLGVDPPVQRTSHPWRRYAPSGGRDLLCSALPLKPDAGPPLVILPPSPATRPRRGSDSAPDGAERGTLVPEDGSPPGAADQLRCSMRRPRRRWRSRPDRPLQRRAPPRWRAVPIGCAARPARCQAARGRPRRPISCRVLARAAPIHVASDT